MPRGIWAYIKLAGQNRPMFLPFLRKLPDISRIVSRNGAFSWCECASFLFLPMEVCKSFHAKPPKFFPALFRIQCKFFRHQATLPCPTPPPRFVTHVGPRDSSRSPDVFRWMWRASPPAATARRPTRSPRCDPRGTAGACSAGRSWSSRGQGGKRKCGDHPPIYEPPGIMQFGVKVFSVP